jgi:KaiC/GvpD/RAD55 family RecA-like ATPase
VRTIKPTQEWFTRVLPEGILIGSSTLLSGPGGSGKPLIGESIASEWLRQGGSVIFMSLQYPSPDFVYASMKNVAGLDLNDYNDRIAFIALDATIEGMEAPEGNRFRANVVKPEIWDAALQRADEMVPNEGPGILVFGSAINLLLFSPTYGKAILEKVKRAMTTEKAGRTYLFSASTTAKAEEIAELEAVAENLIFTRSEKQPFRLFMRVARAKGVPFVDEEIEVPIPPGVLLEVKEVADHSRKRVIPQVSRL